jgi:hypothetical protein
MKYLVLFALVALFSRSVTGHAFKQCGSADHLHISTLTLTPDKPIPGQNLEVEFSGTTDESVAAGSVALKVSVLGITIATISFDICKDLGITCPVNGAFTAKINYEIPSAAPAGIQASAKVEVTDGSGAELDCIDIGITIGKAQEEKVMVELNHEEAMEAFESWRQEYNKDFSPAEYVTRMKIFDDNHRRIVKHNSGNSTWKMAHNEFSHLTWEEFRSSMLGFGGKPEVDEDRDVFEYTGQNLQDSVDWTTKGAVTKVKNQGQCGSCWAFSTTGGLEGAYFIKNNKLVSFSEQELVDCDHNGDMGCNGGLMDHAFSWIKSNGGLCSEDDYGPYQAKDGTCKKGSCTSVSGSAPKKVTDVSHNEKALMAAVSQQPVSIAIEADQSGFQFYSSGVFTGSCGTNLDHGVLAVGYGTEGGTDYWKVKNSWGTSWGARGYIKMQRGKKQSGGQCGILNSASFPTL